jgi:formate hydrogenlyase transcriptional activator
MANDSDLPPLPEARASQDISLAPSELAVLLRISQADRDREALCTAITKAVEELLAADRVLVAIPGWHGAAVRVYAVPGAVKLIECEDIAKESIPAWVIRNRRSIAVSSVEHVQHTFAIAARELVEQGLQSAVVLPLCVQDGCLGAFGVMARAAGTFDGHLRLLDGIANVVAVALDNCLAYERLRRLGQERKALLDVNAAIGRHLERDELFGALAACLRDLVPTDHFGIELPIEGDKLQGHLLTPRRAEAEPTQPTILPAAGTACNWVIENRGWLVASSREELRTRFPVTFDVMGNVGMESLCALALVSGDRSLGALFFMAVRKGAYGSLRRDFLEQVAAAVAVALDDCLAHEEVRRLRDRLAAENLYLQEEIQQAHNFEEIIGTSAALRQMLSQVETVAPTDSTVLILGETGTGKELIARAIHDRSARRGRPLVKVNCAAISAGLVESELFGHVKGAFTGAVAARTGRFELADGGTIFLDEIGELPLETQVKLLRVLQEHEFEPVGSNQSRRVNVRLIAATNRDLRQAVAEGRFRSDLFFRVNVLPIRVPALRERREDIPLLVHFFVNRYARQMAKRVDGVSRKAMDRLMAYGWPGNVRELQNIIERAVVLAQGPVLDLGSEVLWNPAESGGPSQGTGSSVAAEPAPSTGGAEPVNPAVPEDTSLDQVSREHISLVLERCGWVIEGPHGAARVLGLRPSTLRSRMKKLGLQPPTGRRLAG